jgi:signal transduction histidine kinase
MLRPMQSRPHRTNIQVMDEKLNILLVDDQPTKLMAYEAVLGELGENLIEAHSGMEALEQLLKNDVALVLMDVCMPGMDGFETAEMIHQHPRFENTPIVFVSGVCVTEMDRLKGYRCGAVDYVPVPTPPDLLRAKVKTLVDLHRKTRQLEALNAKMTLLQEEERRRIARDLHDSVGQLLAAISMNHGTVQSESSTLSTRAAQCLQENADMVEEVSRQIRTISYLLHPPLLDEAGLEPALRCFVDGFAKRSDIAVTLHISPNLGRLPQGTEICIFRVVQECLTNVHRHSGSRTAAVRVTREKTYVRVEIEDAGKGIPVPTSRLGSSMQAGVGVLGMRERLRNLGGTLDIRSNHEGTLLAAVLPSPMSDGSEATASVVPPISAVPSA